MLADNDRRYFVSRQCRAVFHGCWHATDVGWHYHSLFSHYFCHLTQLTHVSGLSALSVSANKPCHTSDVSCQYLSLSIVILMLICRSTNNVGLYVTGANMRPTLSDDIMADIIGYYFDIIFVDSTSAHVSECHSFGWCRLSVLLVVNMMTTLS